MSEVFTVSPQPDQLPQGFLALFLRAWDGPPLRGPGPSRRRTPRLGSAVLSSSATPTGTSSRGQSHSSFAGVPLAQRGTDDVLLRTPPLAAEPPLDTDPPLAADPPLDP